MEGQQSSEGCNYFISFFFPPKLFPTSHTQTRTDPMSNTNMTNLIHTSYSCLMEHMLYPSQVLIHVCQQSNYVPYILSDLFALYLRLLFQYQSTKRNHLLLRLQLSNPEEHLALSDILNSTDLARTHLAHLDEV